MRSVQTRRQALESRFAPWVRRPLGEHFDHVVRQFGERPYIITDVETLTYREVQQDAERLAKGLVELGVKPGDHVGLLLANYSRFPALKIAIAKAGAVAVPINFLNKADELGYVLAQSDVVALITMDSFRGMDYCSYLDQLANGWEQKGGGAVFPRLKNVFVVPTGGASRPQARTVDDLAGYASDNTMLPEVSCDDVADIIYTSGTTGNPKGVLLTHDMMVRTAYGSAYSRAQGDGQRILFSLPMYHVYGYVEGMLAATFGGSAIVPQLVWDAKKMIEIIPRQRVDDILLVPTMTWGLLDAMDEVSHDVRSLKTLISSGGYSPPQLWDRIRRGFPGVEFTTGYGMTELTATTTLTDPDDPFEVASSTNGRQRTAGCAGDPELGGILVEYRAADPVTGRALDAGEVGELQARGPGVTSGYYNKPDETAKAFTADGWFRSGDLGRFDERGYLQLVGRTKETYRCGGEQVMPLEVENLLMSHPDVLQAFVVPVPDERMGEVGFAWIVPVAGTTVDEENIRAYATSRLARFKIPKHVYQIAADDVPVTPSGRPRKFLLAKRARETCDQGPLAAATAAPGDRALAKQADGASARQNSRGNT